MTVLPSYNHHNHIDVQRMKTLLTGGAGYIGSHTAIELLNSGHQVVVLDNFSNSHPEALKRVAQITGFIIPCI